jgi:hypothetical protein
VSYLARRHRPARVPGPSIRGKPGNPHPICGAQMAGSTAMTESWAADPLERNQNEEDPLFRNQLHPPKIIGGDN